ncbi:hypothetical protein ACVMGC_001060 [Bradyrhizobium barranii subsp. barranii]|uniref:hypothetical protein n=1 Tax=Bradyrhizobium TaxID=374 RepID=UPI001BACE9BF|nr:MULTISPECIES: hypothetical protein [Bradyrhizobium]MBR0879658.1 hypothetical protein [Bradyrhizobium liaoningense]MCP1778787.1 hypothetical protein [Bradyrhizobium japonicum]MCP1958215.1 hypothetical protein [Bradyrhizobium japonicum]
MTTAAETTTNNGKGRAPRARIPEGEKREDKFVRLAIQRMNAVQSKIRQVKNLARYPHTEDQARRIINELRQMAIDIETAFTPREKPEQFRF